MELGMVSELFLAQEPDRDILADIMAWLAKN
jgi:hypothetical protein